MTLARHVLATMVLLSAMPLLAAPPASQPATKEAQSTAVPAPAAPKGDAAAKAAESPAPMKVTVVSVTGAAEKMTLVDGKGKWEPLKAGEQLDELTVIRTGLSTTVALKFEDRAEVTINNATKIGIGQCRRQGAAVKAQLGLKYGSVHADVEKARGPTDFKIATPVAVASVRGTSGNLGFSGDLGLKMEGNSGTWALASGTRSIHINPGEWTNSDFTAPIELRQEQRDPHMGDVFGGLTFDEQRNLRDNGGGRGILGFTGSSTDSGSVVPSPPPAVPGGGDINIGD